VVSNVAAQPQEAAAQQESAKEIPVDPELRAKLRAIFKKHTESALTDMDKARSKWLDALIADSNVDEAKADFDRRAAEVNKAKKAMIEELDEAGYSKEIQEQEWKKWFEARAEKKKEKTSSCNP
jgi:hypothetical protein